MRRLFSFLILAALSLSLPKQGDALEISAAGVPPDVVGDRNYAAVYLKLAENGISSFVPTFQYVEVPQAKSLGFESDFAPPCQASDPAFAALRNSTMKLIIPADILYPNPGRIGQGQDPLLQLIECAGRENIRAVANYDEAILNGIAERHVKAVYDHIKSIVPDMPVIMVHGPMFTDRAEHSSANRRADYLRKVQSYSRFADIVGFDVYPHPAPLAKVSTPMSDGEMVDIGRAISDYTAWTNAAFEGKDTLIVLQGFSYVDLFDPDWLRQNFSERDIAAVTAPSAEMVDGMLQIARDNGIDLVVWWGQAALKNQAAPPWQDILSQSKRYAR